MLGLYSGHSGMAVFFPFFQLCGWQSVGGGLDVSRVGGWQVSSKNRREEKRRWEGQNKAPAQDPEVSYS